MRIGVRTLETADAADLLRRDVFSRHFSWRNALCEQSQRDRRRSAPWEPRLSYIAAAGVPRISTAFICPVIAA